MIHVETRAERVCNRLHATGLALTFPVAFVTLAVLTVVVGVASRSFGRGLSAGLEFGGYAAIAGSLLVVVAAFVESFDNMPRQLAGTWVWSVMGRSALLGIALTLMGVGRGSFLAGLVLGAVAVASVIMGVSVRYATLASWHDTPFGRRSAEAP